MLCDLCYECMRLLKEEKGKEKQKGKTMRGNGEKRRQKRTKKMRKESRKKTGVHEKQQGQRQMDKNDL